jgi:hypothetical protein
LGAQASDAARDAKTPVAGEPFFDSKRERIVALSARGSVASVYAWREYVLAGGLMSYGTDLPDSYREAAFSGPCSCSRSLWL